MRFWNLSTFEDVIPEVRVPVVKENTVSAEPLRARRRMKYQGAMSATMGTVVVVAAMSLTALTVTAQGSDTELRLSASNAALSNATLERPPLALLFGGQHPDKWDEATERAMLARAANALSRADKSQNEANLIHASLKEQLPASREDLVDLAKLGIKLR